MPEQPAPRLFSSPVWLGLLLALLAVLLYWPTLTGGLVFDDHNLLEYHPRLMRLTVREAFTTDFWGMNPTPWKSMHYRPLALLAYAGMYRLFGMETVAFHLVNIFLHGVAVLALFLLLDGAGFSRRVSLTASCLFAVDPLHVEAVAWITGMMETLMVALCLASLASFVRGRRVWSVVLAGAAMLVKETAFVLPLLVFLLEWHRTERQPAPQRPAWRSAEIAALPYVPLVVICLAARGIILPRMPEDLQTRFLDGLPIMASVAAAYLRLLLWPWPLAISYALPGAGGIAAAFGFVAVATAILWRLRRTRPTLFRDVLLSCGLILLPLAAPVLASPLMGEWIQVQDRYAYLSSAGTCLLAALLLASFSSLKNWGLAVAVLLVALGAWGTWRQEPVWATSEATWRCALRITPESQFVSISLARDLVRDGRFHDAALVIDEALRYRPRSASLGSFRIKVQQLEAAAIQLRNPTHGIKIP